MPPRYSRDWQHLVCLLYVLNTARSPLRRREATDAVLKEDLLSLDAEDLEPYPSQDEPSWRTDIAWGRKIAVIAGWIDNDEHDSWRINRAGIQVVEDLLLVGARGGIEVQRCYLWSDTLRCVFNPLFQRGSPVAIRPPRPRHIPDATISFAWGVTRGIVEKYGQPGLERAATKLTAQLGFSVLPQQYAVAAALRLREDLEARQRERAT
jgi:hypothetical protein